MNIISASVSDRRASKARPILTVTIDSMPVPTNEVIRREDSDRNNWTSAKYGPLIEFACASHRQQTDLLLDTLSPASYFNKVFADGLAPVVDVKVIHRTDSSNEILEGNWAVQLRRGRNLLKKYDLPWRLLMNDYDGQKGRLSWTPTENRHTCAFNFLSSPPAICKDAGQHHVSMSGIDYWFCPSHYKDHNAKHYSARSGR